MSTFAIVSLFVLCAISCADRAHGSHAEISPAHLSVGEVTYLAHSRLLKRQTVPTQDLLECSFTASDYQCGSSGYAQRSVDVALSCGNETLARNTANSCAKSESGTFCGTATSRLISDQTELTNAFMCTGAVTLGSCPSNCSTFLQSARSKLGCCINTYINQTDGPLPALFNDFFDYRLWNLCNVDLPASDCGNSLPLNPPADAQTCTTSEFVRRSLQYQCMPSVGQPLIDALLQSGSNCDSLATSLVDVCATNANGQRCGEVISLNLIASASSDPLLSTLQSSCTSTTTCNSTCRSAVTNVNSAYGCCVNIYNTSNFQDFGVPRFPSLSYNVWNECGVSSPGFCTSTLSTSTLSTSTLSTSTLSTSASATTVKIFGWMIAAAVALYYIMC